MQIIRLLSCFAAVGSLAAAAQWNPAVLRQRSSFEPNPGQSVGKAGFITYSGGRSLFVTNRGFEVAAGAHGVTVHIEMLDVNPTATAQPLERLPGVSNYLLGNDERDWRVGVPRYARLRYAQVYPGVDLLYYFNQSDLEHDFVIAPGADWKHIRFRVTGINGLTIDGDGDLLLETSDGNLVEKKPKIYQEIGGRKRMVEGGYAIRHGREFGFDVKNYDPTRPLIIDPVITFSTYLGGGGSDQPNSIALDAQGNAYVTGTTTSVDFPTKNAVQAASAGGSDVFVTKLDGVTGAIIYSTYLGGSADDDGIQIKVDQSGNAIVAGTTSSTNFPVAGKLQTKSGGGVSDAFVAKLNAAGNALVYSTYLGGSDADAASALDLDSQGNAYVVGATYSTDFPATRPSLQSSSGGGLDGFIAKINAAGTQFVYASYLGWHGADAVTAVAVNTLGEAYVVGWTTSTDLPTTPQGSRWPFLAGGIDAFMARITASGYFYEYISYYGGSLDDIATSLAVDPSDPSTILIGVLTESPDFPGPTGGGTNLLPGKAAPFIAKFKIPSSSPGLSATGGFRPEARQIDDYDWLSSLEKAVENLDAPPPDWDSLLKQLEKDTQTNDKNLKKLLQKLGEIAWDKASKAIKDLIQDFNDGLDVGELIRNFVNGTDTDTTGKLVRRATQAPMAPLLFILNPSNGIVTTPAGFPAGSGLTNPVSFAADSLGNLSVAAQTNDSNLPVSASGVQPAPGTTKGYVVKFTPQASQFNSPVITSVTNAFGGSTTIASNTWIAIKGSNLAPAGDARIWKASDFVNNLLPVQLDGVSVTMNGQNAYVWYISATQLNVLTPPGLAAGPVQVTVTAGSATSAAFTSNAASSSLSMFVFGGGPYVLGTHLDGGDLGPASLYPGLTTPAKPGELVVLYGNGFGTTSVPVVPGGESQSGTLPALPVIQIGGANAAVQFAGLVAPGLYQFNVQVPSSAQDGDNPLTVQYNGSTVQSGLMLTVQH